MVIISQEKDGILNFDNIEAIRLMASIDEDERKLIAIDMLNGERYLVAKYETEERAKEVIKEIIKSYQDTNYEYENCWCLRNIIYQMPEE